MSDYLEIFTAFWNGFHVLFAWPVFSAMMIGIISGMVVGLIPGLGGLVAHILLIPFALQMDTVPAIAMLLGVYAVISQTECIPAVLLGVPGTVNSMATTLEGFPMSKRGEGGRALSAAHFAVICGTVMASVIFIAILPGLRAMVRHFSSPEFFMMMILGLVIASTLTGRSRARGLLMAGIGLMLGTIGQAPGTGDPRYVGPFLYLWEGVPMIPILLGLFGVPELLDLGARNKTIAQTGHQVITMTTGLWAGIRDVLINKWLVLRCSLIGVASGFIPGLGGTAAEWMSYASAVATDKDKATFGRGNVRGVIAPEVGVAAHMPAAIIPTVAFGIPGNPPMAVLLGVFVILGVRPGPEMLTTNLDQTFMMVNTVTVAGFISAIICLFLQRWLAQLCFVRAGLIVPFVMAAMFVGAGFFRLSLGDVGFFAAAGMIGFVFKHLDWPRVPLVMGLILGKSAEPYFFASIDRYGATWLYDRPIVLALEVLIILTLFSGVLTSIILKAVKSQLPARKV